MIIIPAVFVFFFYLAADFDFILWCHGHIPKIEKGMDIFAQQKSVINGVWSVLVIGPDMSRV